MKKQLLISLSSLLTVAILNADTENNTDFARLAISSSFALKTLKAIEDGDLSKAKKVQDIILLGNYASLKDLFVEETSIERKSKILDKVKPIYEYISKHPNRFPSTDMSNAVDKWTKSLMTWYEEVSKSPKPIVPSKK